MKTEEKSKIEKYLDENEDCKSEGTFQIEYRGKLANLQIYRLPLDILTYNLENGRFAADKLDREAELGRKLDMGNKEDVKIIKELLLKRDSNETERLKENLKKIGQLDPGIITIAGNLINANRRMAILSELKSETGNEKYGYLRVGILPKGATTKDIWRIEARIQYARDFKVKYSSINQLLKIDEAITNQGMDESEVAGAIGIKPEEIKSELKRLRLIERYLNYIGMAEQYIKIEEKGINEHFINTLKNLDNSKGDFKNIKEQSKFMNLHFELITAGSTHLFIRKLRDISNYEEVKTQAFSSLDNLKEEKISLELFKEEVEDAISLAEIKNKERKPLQLLQHAHNILLEVEKSGQELDQEGVTVLGKIKKLTKLLMGN